MPKIHFQPDEKTIEANEGQSILKAALKAGIPHYYTCGGATRCTTCRVTVTEGLENCAPRTEKEESVASRLHFGPDIRLACQTSVTGDVTLRRLVLDENDVAFTSQQIVERVRAEILVMRNTEDITNVVGVLWEGLQDVGIYADYCAIDILDTEANSLEIFAATRSWLERESSVAPLRRDILPKRHCYHQKIALTDRYRQHQQQIRETHFSEMDEAIYQAYFAEIWRIEPAKQKKQPKSWMMLPFSHGFLTIHSFKPGRFSGKVLQILESFADAVSLAYARFLNFQRLEKRNAELQEAYSRLKDLQVELVQTSKMAALGQLVSGIAHEINTPLGSLQSSIDVYIRSFEKMQKILNEDASLSNEGPPKNVARIFTSINRLIPATKMALERIDTIVSNLRKFARLDQAAMDRMDIHDGLEAVLKLLEPNLQNIIVEKNYGVLPKVLCSPEQLNQAFMNILLNSVQAMGGKGSIFIATQKIDSKVQIEIRDTGKGISQENLAHIFDPGFTTKGVGVGIGMGLSIVYNIIKNHQGKIDVESDIGKGTVIRILLPIQ